MSHPTCPLCGNQDSEKRFTERQHDLRVCAQCGLWFIDPYPANDEARHQTIQDYSFDEMAIADTRKHYAAEVQYYQRYFSLFEAECREATSVLDVGCGTGRLLELLGQNPSLYRAGVELNSARAETARRMAACEIYETPIEEFTSERKFDVITMVNVLSHIPSFDKLFTALRGLLSEHGKFVLKIGEAGPQAQHSDLYDWGIPDHLHFCGLNTLGYISRKYGLPIASHQRTPYAQEFYSRERWTSPGGSAVRNAVKLAVAYTPFALPILAKIYTMKHGDRLFSSFVVFTR